MDFKQLDPVLHSQLRLSIMSILMHVKQEEFTLIKEKTRATAGNLSVQLHKLKTVGYVDIVKQFKENYPQTICRITRKGTEAFDNYFRAIQSYMLTKEAAM